MSYLLYQNDKIVGVFDNLIKAKDMAQGVIDNGWATNFSIVKYKTNTCCKEETISVDENDNFFGLESDSEENDIEDEEEKRKLQDKLNVLRQQKDKLEESKAKYEVDLKLYKDFKEKLEHDNNFVIPEMFVEKYKIFHQLDVEDNITWESFSLLYKEPDFYGKYSNIFEITNSFETKFLQDIDSDTEESENSETSEDTDSDNVIEIIQVVNSSDEESSSD